MTNISTAEDKDASENGSRKGIYRLLSVLSVSHGIFHFMSQSFSVMIPTIKDAFGINPVQVGALITVKTLAGGIASLPGGIISDYFRKYRARLMAICLVVYTIGWLIVGASSVYPLLFLGMVAIAVAGSVYHLPSLAELGVKFSKRRGASLAVFGAGGSLGDILGPVITGLLLGALTWRGLISIYASIPLLMAFGVIWAFNGSDTAEDEKKEIKDPDTMNLREQLRATKAIMKETHIWRVNVVAGLRGMSFDIIATFFPLFMKEQLGFSTQSIGFHFGLLWTVGIFVSPLMGHLSDRFGRKLVLVPALFYSSALIIALALFGKGIMFTILLALLGISIRSDYSILSAAILDIAGEKVATTMLGILSFTRFGMAAVSPLIAGVLYQYVGMEATLWFIAILFVISGFIFMSVDLKKQVKKPHVHKSNQISGTEEDSI